MGYLHCREHFSVLLNNKNRYHVLQLAGEDFCGLFKKSLNVYSMMQAQVQYTWHTYT